MAYIVQFSDVGKDDVSLVGGKGANLGEMTRAGLPVPPGFIVTAKAYYGFLDIAGLRDRIAQILANLDYDDNQALGRASDTIKRLITSAEMPKDVAEEIKKAYRDLSGPEEDMYVAVRSSATAEDLPKASFAGQQATFLNVKGEENVVDAVQRAWASLFEARAIFYRYDKGFDHFRVSIAIPVQKMVESEKSGVMFTVEPLTNNRDELEIEAIFGLGEAIVTGAVNPDIYIVRKSDLQIIDKKIASQPWKIELREGKNQHMDIPLEQREVQKLTDDEIIELARYGITLEDHYNFPQDAEWAIEGGTIYLVQTRPITTLAPVEAPEEKPTGEVILEGIAASTGMTSGPAKIVHGREELGKVIRGDVLVAPMTNPDFVPGMR
ncbi:MAG TPA: PEP/pyruvate-binding domain-containing protein, partial [Anaerolineae bacterium]|nr:PEP/pyruvate-binding domain-containing protein [Anaerolineae bacterium]